jgi:lipoprotein-anchoring transpeptidase ErfK/SrfK
MQRTRIVPHHIRHYHLAILPVLLLLAGLLSACNPFLYLPRLHASAHGPLPAATIGIDSTTQKQAEVKLQIFQQWITLLGNYHGHTTAYQKQYQSDRQALQRATSIDAYIAAMHTLDTHAAAIQVPTLQIKAQQLQQQLQQRVGVWESQHHHYNDYDHTNYPLGFEYGDKGIGGWEQDDLSTAKTVADYQQAIENLHVYLANFQAMTVNATNHAAYNQPHPTDLQLIRQYGKLNQRVVVVSLEEQAMRVYENGTLVKSMLVTTGRPDRPTPPGLWWVEGKQSPTVFKSGVPPNSPDYYPDTPINYAMQFHSDGYFMHDSWWRNDYGPGTNFPHQDSSGDSFSSQGSHGCVNLSKDDAAWLYDFVQVYTSIIIY